MRYPAVAGRFYPAEKDELRDSIASCFTHELGPGAIGGVEGKRSIKAVVAPHAGYACSGMNAAHAYKAIAEDGRPDAYVIIGPDHYGIPFDSALCTESYLTPLGECKIHHRIADRLAQHVPDVSRAHMLEHSVEVQVPFLQYIDDDPLIVPIIMSDQTIEAAERMGRWIKEACEGFDVVVIASSDMSHYIPKPVAERKDMMLIDRACALDIEGMYDVIQCNDISACGYGPIAASIIATSPTEGHLMKHTDSWDAIRYQKDAVVGYASMVFE